jgi:hypothetical protein
MAKRMWDAMKMLGEQRRVFGSRQRGAQHMAQHSQVLVLTARMDSHHSQE